MKDELFNAQLLRALGYAPYGGADIGECLATAARITRVDATQWYTEWFATAVRLRDDALASVSAGQRHSARSAFFRASNYFRTAGIFLMGAPVDARLRESHRQEVTCFRRGAELLEVPPEQIAIPYAGSSLPGYFFPAAVDGAPRATIILTTGYDGSAEELYFANGAAALERGYNVIAFEGPGQGSVIIERGITFRPDWENVVTPVVDYATSRPDVDARSIVLLGLSFGGYLAPRAATGEHRLAACISDCGNVDLFDASIRRLPPLLAHQLPDGNPLMLRALDGVLRMVMRQPSAGWALRRNMLVHGLRDPLDFFRIAAEYTLKGREHLIRCPMFIATAENDDLCMDMPALVDKLTCPKQWVQFRAAEGAGDHCESGARTLFHQRVFDWLAGLTPSLPERGSVAPA